MKADDKIRTPQLNILKGTKRSSKMEVLCEEKTDTGYDANVIGTTVKEEPAQNQNKLSPSTDCAPNLTSVSSDLVRLENTQSDSGIHPMEWFTNRFSALAEKFTRDLYSPSLNPSVRVSYPQTAKPVGHKSESTRQSSPLRLAGNSPGMFGLHPHQSYRCTLPNSSRLDISPSQPVPSASEDVDIVKLDLKDSVPSTECEAAAESLPTRNSTPAADSPVSIGAGLPEDSENRDSVLSTECVSSDKCVPSRDSLSAVEQTSRYMLPSEDRGSSTSSVPSSSLVPWTKMPETLVPETSVSKTSVSETSVRETSVSENSVPETLEPEPLTAVKSEPETPSAVSVPPTQTLPPGPPLTSIDTAPAGASEEAAAYAALASSGGLERRDDDAMEVAPHCVTDEDWAEMPGYLCPGCHSYRTTKFPCDCRRPAGHRPKGEGSSKAGVTLPRRRRVFSSEQIKELEEMFKQNSYVKVTDRQELAEKLGLPDNTIKVWFQNRRSKEKRATNHFMLPYMHPMPPQLAFTPTLTPYPNNLHATPSPCPPPAPSPFRRLPRPSSPPPSPALPPPPPSPSLPPPRPSSPSPYPRTCASPPPPPPSPPHHAHRSAFHTYPAVAARLGLLTSQPKVMSQAAAADVLNARAPEVPQRAAGNELLASPAPSSTPSLSGTSSSDEEEAWLETLALISLVKHTKGKSAREISQLAQQLLATGVGVTTPCPCSMIPGVHTTGTHLRVLAVNKPGIFLSQLQSLTRREDSL